MGKAACFKTRDARRVTMKPVAAKPNLRNQQRVDVATEARIETVDGSFLLSFEYFPNRPDGPL